jgi:hypothetical protein
MNFDFLFVRFLQLSICTNTFHTKSFFVYLLYIQVSVKYRDAIKSTAFNFLYIQNKYVTLYSHLRTLYLKVIYH